MADRILTDRVIENIKKYSDGREVVMFGRDDDIQQAIIAAGYKSSKIFTGNPSLLQESDIYTDSSALKGKADKYYVVIPFLLPDKGESQRDIMDRFGYEKYTDYIFYPNEDAADTAIYNAKKYSNGREVAAYGYTPPLNLRFKEAGYEIKTFFTGNGDLLADKSLNCTDFRQMKDKSDQYYIIIPFFLEDGGAMQRRVMSDFGYKYIEDYCFCQEAEPKPDDSRFKNKEIAKRLYIPDRYKDKWYSAFDKKYLSDRKLKVTELENGVVLPVIEVNRATCGGVCDEKYNFIAGHLSYSPNGRSVGRISRSYIPDEEPEYFDETVIFGGAMYNHPGHLMYEMFCQRLWWCVQNPDSDLRIAICFTWGDKEGTFIRQFLELLGIDLNRIIFVKKPMKFKKIIIPDQAMYPLVEDTPYDITREYISVYEQISKNITPGKDKKIYLTKLKTQKRDIANEKYFVEFYRSKGFRIVDPEDYTIKEKAEMMAGADEVASNIGTNTMFAVFCKPDVRITLTTRVNDQVMDCQAMAHEVRGITDFYVVDVSLNFLHKHRIWGTNVLGVTDEWKKYVKDIYGEDISETTESSLKDGLYEYLKRSAEYYSSPNMFRLFAGYDQLKILNNMNEVFLGKPLSAERYNQLAEVQREARMQEGGGSSYAFDSLFDILINDKCGELIKAIGGKNVSLLCNDSTAAGTLRHIFRSLGVNVRFFSQKSRLKELSEDEWKKCRNSDKIISYDIFGYDPGRRDGVKAYDIRDIFSEVNDAPSDANGRENELSILREICLLRDELGKQTALLDEQLKRNADAEKQIDRLYAERGVMNEHLIDSIIERGKLKEELSSSEQERDKLENSVSELEKKASRSADEIKKINTEYDAVSRKLKEEQNAGELKDNRITELSKRVSEMENSRSWRFTKPFRAINSSLRNVFRKEVK